MPRLIQQVGPIEQQYRGSNFQITQRLMKAGAKEKIFEEARRAPGTRSIILSSDKSQMLLTYEYRHQLDQVDIRLPGGKVFDSLDEYLKAVDSQADITQTAIESAKKEILEEAGQVVDEITLLKKTKCGGMMEWDLYYFVVTQSHESSSGQQLGSGEEIETKWVDISEVVNYCLSGKMNEERSVAVILQYCHLELKRI